MLGRARQGEASEHGHKKVIAWLLISVPPLSITTLTSRTHDFFVRELATRSKELTLHGLICKLLEKKGPRVARFAC